MKVGDLVKKVKGYNPAEGHFHGLVLGFKSVRKKESNGPGIERVIVCTPEGVELWVKNFVEVISEG